jgi:hypothetical protein
MMHAIKVYGGVKVRLHYFFTLILDGDTMGTRPFQEVKRLGLGINSPPPSSTEVKERVEPYLYSPSVPSWQTIG